MPNVAPTDARLRPHYCDDGHPRPVYDSGRGILRRRYVDGNQRQLNWRATLVVAVFFLWLFLATIAEVWLWADVYHLISAIETLKEALYFSTVTFTTLGYGDVVLNSSWRLFASEAANGLFLFRWSTTLVFAVVQ